MEIFSQHQFKKIYLDQEIFTKPDEEIKIGYININGLYSAESCSLINQDFNLRHLDLLLVADTRLSSSDGVSKLENSLSNWKVVLRADSEDTRKHMGMLLLASKSSNIRVDQITLNSKQGFKSFGVEQMVYVQIVRIKYKTTNIGFVYIRETPDMKQLQALKEAFRNSDCIMGDLNLDPNREDDRKKLQQLCGPDKIRILHEHTTVRSNQLDHIIMKSDIAPNAFATSYLNHSSDHRTITVRIPLHENGFSESFRKDWYFDKEKYTRRPNIIRDLRQVTEARNDIFELNQVDAYLDIMKNVRKDAVVFNLYVLDELAQNEFEDLDPALKSIHILDQAKIVIFPVMYIDNNIQCVAVWKVGQEIVFNFTQIPLKPDLYDLLNVVVVDYIGGLYESFNRESPSEFETKISHLKNMEKWSHKEQWIYLLSFLKSIVFEVDLEPKKFKCLEHERIIVTELRTKKAIPISKPKLKASKRKISVQRKEDPQAKKLKVTTQRYFSNPDQETCWMNSCLQVVLTALDHLDPPVKSGSPLYNYLMYFKDSVRVMPLDPTPVKDLIYLQEKWRILEQNVPSISRLFNFAGTTSTNEAELCLEVLGRPGQQDCRDFFLCLQANKGAWPDVFNLFKFSMEESMVCSSCGSTSKGRTIEDVLSMDLGYPKRAMPLKDMIVAGEERGNWRCEDGCNQVTVGKHFTKVKNVSETLFLTIIVPRLKQREDGSLEILTPVCEVTEDVTITDANAQSAVFSPIAVIHHTGIVTGGNDTRGHYRADVRSPVTDEWFQTSDDQLPAVIPSPSSQCYITIYKKKSL